MPIQKFDSNNDIDNTSESSCPDTTNKNKRKHSDLKISNQTKHSLIFSASNGFSWKNSAKKLKTNGNLNNNGQGYLNDILSAPITTTEEKSKQLDDDNDYLVSDTLTLNNRANCVTLANGITVTTECNAFTSDSDIDLDSLSNYSSSSDDNSNSSTGEYSESGQSLLSSLFSPVFSFLSFGTTSHDSTLKSFIKKPIVTEKKDEAGHQQYTQLTNFSVCQKDGNGVDESLQSPQQDGFDPYCFIRNIKRPLQDQKQKTVLPLPTRRTPKMCLILDLDETLVHCSLTEVSNYDMTFDIQFEESTIKVFVRTRPHLQEFLEKVSKWYEVILFTASQRAYADKLINLIDPKRTIFRHRLFREHCSYVNGTYVKDLDILGKNSFYNPIP